MSFTDYIILEGQCGCFRTALPVTPALQAVFFSLGLNYTGCELLIAAVSVFKMFSFSDTLFFKFVCVSGWLVGRYCFFVVIVVVFGTGSHCGALAALELDL